LKLSEIIMEINNLRMRQAGLESVFGTVGESELHANCLLCGWLRRPGRRNGMSPKRHWNYLKLSWKSTTYEWDRQG